MLRQDENQNDFEQQVAALAERAGSESSTGGYEEEKSFLDTLRVLIATQKDAFDHEKDVDVHGLRKSNLRALFWLTCVWLFAVVCFVAMSAVSPSVSEREKILEIREKYEGKLAGSLISTNVTHRQPVIRYCPLTFKLSDTVLVAFITSTTVSVIGLFIIAAQWLYASKKEKAP